MFGIRTAASAAILLVALSGCGGADQTDAAMSEDSGPDYSDTGKQMAWIETSKDAIKAKLKDPDSAQWRNVEFYSGSGSPIVCGEVNAKNSFGGYSGFERFVAAGSTLQVLESEMADGEMTKTWDQLCI